MNYSITRLYRRGLLLLSVVLASLVLLAQLAITYSNSRTDMMHELTTQGKMIADLSEQDGNIVINAPLIGQMLVNADLLFGCVITGHNQILGSVKGLKAAKEADAEHVCRSTEEYHFWEIRPVRVLVPILSPKLNNSVIGVVVLVANAPLRTGWMMWAVWFVALVAVIALVSLKVMQHVRRRIQRPLSQIAAAAQRVSLYKDYSLRLSAGNTKKMPDEIASVIESMNNMLVEIEDRDA
ncbi:MAG: hypothetical protein B7X02_02415, partial [Rhodospirillales bacterium 12-54-5]